MRTAVLILGLCVAAAMGVHCYVHLTYDAAPQSRAFYRHVAVDGLVGTNLVLGAAYAQPMPRVSMFVFLIIALFAFREGWGSGLIDMYLWGGLSLVLAAMSYLGVRELQNPLNERNRERDEAPHS
jgi:hypothetical protein